MLEPRAELLVDAGSPASIFLNKEPEEVLIANDTGRLPTFGAIAPFNEEEESPSENGDLTSGGEEDGPQASQKDFAEFLADNGGDALFGNQTETLEWRVGDEIKEKVREVLPSLDEELNLDSVDEKEGVDEEEEDDDGDFGPVPLYKLQREREAAMAEEEEELYFKNEWPRHEKHIFILSSAGKPVYSRYGDEQKLCSFMPVLSAISSFVDEAGDTIRTIVAGDHQFVFLFRGPLYFVAISKTLEPASHIARQLEYIHSQILSSLTAGVNKIYETRAHFDIRSLLGSATEYLDSLVDMMDNNMSFLTSFVFNSVACLRLDYSMRNSVGHVLQSFHTNELVYCILVARQLLVHVVRLKKHALHAEDFHLILNFIASNPIIHTPSSSTVPVCLPKFNDRGYLHIYVSFLMPEVSLLLVSTKPGDFDNGKIKIEKGLKEVGALEAIRLSLARLGGDNQFYRLKDVQGLDNRSSSPPLSPAASPPPPSYIVHKGKSPLHQRSTSQPPSVYPSSPSKFMLFFKNNPPGSPSSSTSSSASSSTPSSNSSSSSSSASSSSQNSLTTFHPQPSASSPNINNHTPRRFSFSSFSAPGSPSSSGGYPTKIMPYALPPARNFLLHFLYKDQKTSQFTCPQMEPPYNSPREQKRLFRLYQHINVRTNGAHWQENNKDGTSSSASKRKKKMVSHKVYYHISKRESVLAWVTPGFELYATFGPMAAKASAIRVCNQLLRWIKSEEDNIFIQNTPVW